MKALSGSALLALASAGEALGAFVVGVLVAHGGGAVALGRFATTLALLLAAVTLTELGQNAYAFASLNAVLIAQLYAWHLERRAALSEAVLLGSYFLVLRRARPGRARREKAAGEVERLAVAGEAVS